MSPPLSPKKKRTPEYYEKLFEGDNLPDYSDVEESESDSDESDSDSDVDVAGVDDSEEEEEEEVRLYSGVPLDL